MKLIFTVLFTLCSVSAFATEQDCLAKSKELFNDKDYPSAEAKLKECLRFAPSDTDALISLAGVQMILGEFANAEKSFKTALKYDSPKLAPYKGYIFSLLGDIAIRNVNLVAATEYYKSALSVHPANINAIVGLGICTEKEGRIQDAAALYKKALAVDFTNIVARERLIALEPDVLSEGEMLTALKERNIIDTSSAVYSQEDVAVLRKMLAAERDSAIEYLSGKYGGRIPPGFIVERDSGKIYVRKMLTLTGYNEVVAQLSADAKQFFMAKNIQPSVIFKLRDAQGNAIFDEKGHLNDSGLNAYTKALLGQKSYFLPNETLPNVQSETDALAKKYIAQGYSEITMPEYEYLLTKSRCSEQTLVRELRAKIIKVNENKKRVFLVSDPKQTEPFIVPFQMVAAYRVSYHESKKNGGQPVYSSSFGLGGNKEIKLCRADGTLFGIDAFK